MLEVWPNLELFMHGGVSFRPYRGQFRELMPSPTMNYQESYNASEGYFAIQDRHGADDMLLMLDYGIFFEFLPLDLVGSEQPRTKLLHEVEAGKQYAIVISTNAGLWRYVPGDTVRFTSVAPYRIQVSGRTRSFINAFGEELIVENADRAIETAGKAMGAVVNEYTAGPIYMDGKGGGGHAAPSPGHNAGMPPLEGVRTDPLHRRPPDCVAEPTASHTSSSVARIAAV